MDEGNAPRLWESSGKGSRVWLVLSDEIGFNSTPRGDWGAEAVKKELLKSYHLSFQKNYKGIQLNLFDNDLPLREAR